MLKKISHIVLTCLLLIATVGMAVSKHYCAGELVGVSFYGQNTHSCNMGDCCQDETQVYQLKQDYSIPAVSTAPVLAELEILGYDLFDGIGLIIPETDTDASFFDESPPVLPTQKVLALKQVFLL